MPIFHRNILQNDTRWFRIRAGKVTASSIHEVLTPAKLEKSKSSEKYLNMLLDEQMMGRAIASAPYQSDAMEFGHENEQAAAEAFEMMQEVETEEIGFVEREDRKCGASPDRLIVGKPEGLELKSPTPPIHMGYLRNPNALVKEYYMQIQFQCYICEFERVWICSHHSPRPPVVVNAPRDQEYIDRMMPGLALFLAELAEERRKLEERFGAFPPLWMPDLEPGPLAVASRDAIFSGMEVSDYDLDGWLNA